MASLRNFSRLVNLTTSNCLRHVKPASMCKQYYPTLPLLERSYSVIKSYLPWMPKVPPHQIDVTNWDEEKEKIASDVVKEINNQITNEKTGRLFAIVLVSGKQFKVTESDIIIIHGCWAPNIGDQLKLEKVLLIGSTDFTLIGRPLLNRELVTIDATVIEKSLSHTKTRFRMRKRKQFRRINFCRSEHTMLRINKIQLNHNIDEKLDVEGLDRIY